MSTGRVEYSVTGLDGTDEGALETEPYVTGDVWRDISVRPMRIFRPSARS